jgi:hypothetical protein
VVKAKAKRPRAKPCGRSWRVLAWNGDGKPVNVENAGAFDELVVDGWFHMEQMQSRAWWMQIGEVHLWIKIDGAGAARVYVTDGELRPGRGPNAPEIVVPAVQRVTMVKSKGGTR